MRILTLNYDEIQSEAKILDNEIKQIKLNLYKLCWYMRGGVTIDEVFALSAEDKDIMSKIVEENLETTKKSGLPFF
jgi:hypothetical protein